MPRRFITAAAFALTAAACSPDPAKQEPVDLQPGEYAITVSGAGMLSFIDAGDEPPKTYCVRQSDVDKFHHTLADELYRLNGLCTVAREPRVGNAVAGEIKCRADPKMAQGFTRFIYSGALTTDSVRLEVGMKLEADIKEDAMSDAEAAQLRMAMRAMERFRFAIKAERTGDCG